MKKLIILIVLLFSVKLYAVDAKVTALDELTAILGTDILYVIDDPSGTPLSKKITATNLFDMIDTFSELNTIVADKTLVNEEDAAAWDALGTFNLGITITTGDPFTLGTNRWDNGSDLIDGEMIANDTIDNDSIDWGDMTDLGTDGIVSADAVALTTDTTGNYSAGNAEAGDALVSVKVEITDNESTAENNPLVFVAGAAQAGGDLGLESDGTAYYTPSTGTITTTEFVGGGAGVTSVDAITGDSATAFFDAGTIEHEYGGLEADISSYTGLVAITGGSTAEVDAKSELEGHIADVADFAEADGDSYTGAHDFGGATSIEIVNAEDPDVDANGEASQDTDGANEAGDVSFRGFDGANQFLVARKLKTIQATIMNPQDLDDGERDLCPIWHNNTGMVFTITEIWAWSDTDDTTVTVEVVTATDWSSPGTVDALEIAADGTSVYTDTETTISDATIAHDEIITLDFDDTDDPGVVKINIIGWFNSDVD